MKKYIIGLLLLAFAEPIWAECVDGDCSNGKGKHTISNVYHW